jgi:ribosomal protein S2
MVRLNNLQVLSSLLCALGAHLGHIRVDAYNNISHYLLGSRQYFMIIDLDKTVPMLKKALLFFESVILDFGHAVFCYSDISKLNSHMKLFFSRIINVCNQSFSYWRWAPGCITNYRFVFLRLVDFLFSEIRVQNAPIMLRKHAQLGRYNALFLRNYHRLWFLFLREHEKSSIETKNSLRRQFNSFFKYKKQELMNTFLCKLASRDIVAFDFARKASGIIDSNELTRIQFYRRSTNNNRLAKSDKHYDLYTDADADTYTNASVATNNRNIVLATQSEEPVNKIAGEFGQSARVLPNFISLLLRLCYIIRNKFKNYLEDNAFLDVDILFRSLYKRLIAFWRAIIFFRCFQKTANLPDCLIMLNPDNSTAEFNDFLGVRLPIICVADTTTDIKQLTYPIPSNDDSIILLVFYFLLFVNACTSAMRTRNVLLLEVNEY